MFFFDISCGGSEMMDGAISAASLSGSSLDKRALSAMIVRGCWQLLAYGSEVFGARRDL